MKKAFTIFIGFAHDFAAGIWLATVLAVWYIDRSVAPDIRLALQGLMERFFYIGLAGIFMVLAGGVGRTFTYAHVGEVYGADAERLRRKMLIIKHILLLSAFGFGTWWQYTIVFA